MPRKKKRLTERETDDLMKKLFPKRVISKAKEVAHEKDVPKKSSK